MRFALVIERAELPRTQTFPVPYEKELVTRKLEPPNIGLARARGPSAGHEHRRIEVLEATACLGDQVQAHVAVVWNGAPEAMMLVRDRLEVARGTGAVEDSRFTFVDKS